MVGSCKVPSVPAVVVHKLDRLARSVRIANDLIEEFQRRNIAFVAVADRIDLSTPFGWAAFQMQNVWNELYIKNLSFETSKGHTEKARRGLWVGPVPYGDHAGTLDTQIAHVLKKLGTTPTDWLEKPLSWLAAPLPSRRAPRKTAARSKRSYAAWPAPMAMEATPRTNTTASQASYLPCSTPPLAILFLKQTQQRYRFWY